jgi:hypothetical protein
MEKIIRNEVKSVFVIALLLLLVGTLITVGLTDLIQKTYSNNDAIYSQVTFLYK